MPTDVRKRYAIPSGLRERIRAAPAAADVEWYREHLADEFVRSRQSNAT